MEQGNIMLYPIIEGKGIGEIQLGMYKQEIESILNHLKVEEINEILIPEESTKIYTILDSIVLYFFSDKEILVRIDLTGDYKGTTNNNLGIGTKLTHTDLSQKNIFFDDCYIFIGRNSELILTLDIDHIFSLEQCLQKEITGITLETFGWKNKYNL